MSMFQFIAYRQIWVWTPLIRIPNYPLITVSRRVPLYFPEQRWLIVYTVLESHLSKEYMLLKLINITHTFIQNHYCYNWVCHFELSTNIFWTTIEKHLWSFNVCYFDFTLLDSHIQISFKKIWFLQKMEPVSDFSTFMLQPEHSENIHPML